MTVDTVLDGGLTVFLGEDIVNHSTFKYDIMFTLSQRGELLLQITCG